MDTWQEEMKYALWMLDHATCHEESKDAPRMLGASPNSQGTSWAKYPSSHSFPHTPQEEDQELSQVLFSSSSASGVGNRIVFIVLESSGDSGYGFNSFPFFFCKT